MLEDIITEAIETQYTVVGKIEAIEEIIESLQDKSLRWRIIRKLKKETEQLVNEWGSEDV